MLCSHIYTLQVYIYLHVEQAVAIYASCCGKPSDAERAAAVVTMPFYDASDHTGPTLDYHNIPGQTDEGMCVCHVVCMYVCMYVYVLYRRVIRVNRPDPYLIPHTSHVYMYVCIY